MFFPHFAGGCVKSLAADFERHVGELQADEGEQTMQQLPQDQQQNQKMHYTEKK